MLPGGIEKCLADGNVMVFIGVYPFLLAPQLGQKIDV